ncbi:Microtubule-nucleating Tub4p (gamma-tubulin) complex component [Kickxella alabastrina]|uniref:Microtubule-nucleating Tub4p (Gamma-tubulin) complex component n=1 Tax=Kickxella alabastrina TaxID=61397 RepID=A0ACC1II76_9FUNG|nr:Microtubule-nucleating Tub4p (gamma-tubulin) complex component [Kickxella alabastrina]
MESTELDQALYRYMETFLGGLGPANTSEEVASRNQTMRYMRKIAESNITLVANRRDSLDLVEDMQKRMRNTGRGQQAAVHVKKLFVTLQQRDINYDWWPMLHLLSEFFGGGALGSSIGGVGTGIGISGAGIGGNNNSSSGFYAANTQRSARSGYPAAIPPAVSAPMLMQIDRDAMHVDEPQRHASFIAGEPSALQHRALPTFDDVNETDLVHDLVYVMQGIDGTYIRWSGSRNYVIRADLRLSRPTRAMATSICELGAMARTIQEYIAWVDASGKLSEQSFSAELRAEMTVYFAVVADVEARVAQVPRGLRAGESAEGATLRRVLGWTADARLRLRLMVEAIAGVRGGAGGGVLLSTISELVDDGDPFTQAFARRLLRTASAPFTAILVRWVTTGELQDPYAEFFVRESAEPRAWAKRFRVVRDMIPVHYDRVLTRKIFQVGRSLAFLRGSCADADWVRSDAPQPTAEEADDPRRLEAFVYRAAGVVNARLMLVLRDRFGLARHVAAMRRLLMFEQGDFALALLEVLDRHIARAPRQIMAHDLSAALDSAVRSSNAQFEPPEHLASLVLALDDPQADALAEGSSVLESWENVSLRYSLDDPLTHVIDAETLGRYAEISRFLLKLKRIDYALSAVWRQQMTEARSLQRSAELHRRKDTHVSAAPAAEVADVVHRAVRESTIALSEMIQFFHQVQRYISLNVIEGAWAHFLASTQADDIDVDGWNDAHDLYVRTIHGVVCGSAGLGFQRQVESIIATAFQFVSVVKELHGERTLASRANAGVPPVVDKRMSVEDRLIMIRGGHKGTVHGEVFREHASRVSTVVARFRTQVRDLIRVLSHNTTSDLQFLVVTIDFNGAYAASKT